MSNYLGFEPTKDKDYYFISYNSEDMGRIIPIVKKIAGCGFPLWYDYGLEYGEKWEAQISGRIKEAKALLLFLTKGVLQKPESYVRKEYNIATNFYKKTTYVVYLDAIGNDDVPFSVVPWWVDIKERQGIEVSALKNPEDIAEKIIEALRFSTCNNQRTGSDSGSETHEEKISEIKEKRIQTNSVLYHEAEKKTIEDVIPDKEKMAFSVAQIDKAFSLLQKNDIQKTENSFVPFDIKKQWLACKNANNPSLDSVMIKQTIMYIEIGLSGLGFSYETGDYLNSLCNIYEVLTDTDNYSSTRLKNIVYLIYIYVLLKEDITPLFREKKLHKEVLDNILLQEENPSFYIEKALCYFIKNEMEKMTNGYENLDLLGKSLYYFENDHRLNDDVQSFSGIYDRVKLSLNNAKSQTSATEKTTMSDTKRRIAPKKEDREIRLLGKSYSFGDSFDKSLNGKKTKRFSNGITYIGDFSDGVFSGEGRIKFPDEKVYIGEFQNGQITGKGKLYLSGGAFYINGISTQSSGTKDLPPYYEGEFCDGLFDGLGKETENDGSYYEGEFKVGKYCGKGKRVHSYGATEEGEFKNGLLNGKGKRILPDGSYYIGYFIDGVVDTVEKNGYIDRDVENEEYKGVNCDGKNTARIVYSDGSIYEGEVSSGLPHGKGKYIYPNGDYYEGGFKDGERRGKGIGKLALSDDESYEGELLDGFPNGKGKWSWEDGSYYEGEFENGEYCGEGLLFVKEHGVTFSGHFKESALDGEGKEVWASGLTYVGNFKKGQYFGEGKLTYPNGDVYEGIFWEGKKFPKGKYTWKDGSTFEGFFTLDGIAFSGDFVFSDGSTFQMTSQNSWPKENYKFYENA